MIGFQDEIKNKLGKNYFIDPCNFEHSSAVL